VNNTAPVNSPKRLVSLDAFRGFTMLLMASEGFGLAIVAQQFPESSTWEHISYHFSHVEWRGGGLWDMIQPAFTFMVGVSMAFSYSKRKEKGDSYGVMARHAAYRAMILVLLGVLLRTRWTFEDVLAQMGLGYFFLFLLWGRSNKTIIGAIAGLLIGYWALFAFYPRPADDFDLASVSVSQDWHEQYDFEGFQSHWNKNTNPAHAFDVWLLNRLPQSKPFTSHHGGYQTLSFIPSLATMALGLLAGQLLRSDSSQRRKWWMLVAWGMVGVVVAMAIDAVGICPIVKRIWTPSWTLYSAGWSCLMLAALYGLIDILGYRAWAWVGVVVGLNSIAIYAMSYLIHDWIGRATTGLLGADIYRIFNQTAMVAGADGNLIEQTIDYAPLVHATWILLVLWFFCWKLYRQRIFFRI